MLSERSVFLILLILSMPGVILVSGRSLSMIKHSAKLKQADQDKAGCSRIKQDKEGEEHAPEGLH